MDEKVTLIREIVSLDQNGVRCGTRTEYINVTILWPDSKPKVPDYSQAGEWRIAEAVGTRRA